MPLHSTAIFPVLIPVALLRNTAQHATDHAIDILINNGKYPLHPRSLKRTHPPGQEKKVPHQFGVSIQMARTFHIGHRAFERHDAENDKRAMRTIALFPLTFLAKWTRTKGRGGGVDANLPPLPTPLAPCIYVSSSVQILQHPLRA